MEGVAVDMTGKVGATVVGGAGEVGAETVEGAGGGCPSCGATSPCTDWLKITLGFTAAKTVRRWCFLLLLQLLLLLLLLLLLSPPDPPKCM